MGLYFVDGSTLWLGALLVVVSYVAFMLSETFCASFLTDIATPKTMGLISGLGWGIGYFGGLVSLLIVKAVAGGEDGSPAEIVASHQDAMVATGLFLCCCSASYIHLGKRALEASGWLRSGFVVEIGLGRRSEECSRLFRMVRKHERLFQVLYRFSLLQRRRRSCGDLLWDFRSNQLEMTTADLITFFAIIQVLAAVGAMLFGVLESRRGSKETLIYTLILWAVGTLVIFQIDVLSAALGITPKNSFFIDSALIGLGLGSVQACSRTVVGLLTPKEQSAEMFGFWGSPVVYTS